MDRVVSSFMRTKSFLFFLILSLSVNAQAVSLKLGMWGGADSREHVDDENIYGFTAAVLWGSYGSLQIGVGGHKSLQKVNGVTGGYETMTLNFQYGGLYLNPFYGRRAIEASKNFESNNLYPTLGLVFGYDLLLFTSLSLGVMGIYESPGELDSSKTNIKYIKLESGFSPSLSLNFWWH
jgi:hypothetical protein